MAHHAHDSDRSSIVVLTVTVSDTRAAADDVSGERLRALLSEAGFSLASHRIVRDEPAEIAELFGQIATDARADAVITTGGTGIAPRDRTYEALEPLFEKKLDGFGEAFRRLSWEQVGARSVLSRASAGVIQGRFVAALPGSPRAVELAVRELIVPLLGHAVGLLRGPGGRPPC
jgi:molybdenum cofactor biosynthesis protein B